MGPIPDTGQSPTNTKWLPPGSREQPFREYRERIYLLRRGDGGTPDTGDAAAGSTGTGTADRAAGDPTAGATGTGSTGRAAGNRAGCTLRACRTTGATGNHAAGATGAGFTTGTARNHTAGATGAGLTDRATGDRHIGATRACRTDAGTRRAIGVPARRRSGLCSGDRRERDGRSRGTGEHKCRHLRQFHHHERTVTTGIDALNILQTEIVDAVRRSVWCTSVAASA